MSITIQGLEVTDEKLRTVENAEQHLLPPMEEAVDILYRRVQATTPVDTGELIGNLDKLARATPQGAYGAVFFEPTYGPYGHRYDHYVKGEGQQAYMHAGRVPHMGDDLEAVRPQVEALFEAAIERLTRG